MTDGEKVLAFVEKYLRVPDGRLVGEPVQLLPWQREVILAIYDSDPPVRRVIISLGRQGRQDIADRDAVAGVDRGSGRSPERADLLRRPEPRPGKHRVRAGSQDGQDER